MTGRKMYTRLTIQGFVLLLTLQIVAIEPIWVEPVAGNADSGPAIREAIGWACCSTPTNDD